MKKKTKTPYFVQFSLTVLQICKALKSFQQIFISESKHLYGHVKVEFKVIIFKIWFLLNHSACLRYMLNEGHIIRIKDDTISK